jgi:beta propeller repeat protein
MRPNNRANIILIAAVLLLLFPVESSPTFPVTTNEHDQVDLAIYGDIVVWRDDRNGNYDICGYNLSTQEEFQITRDIHAQDNPAIYQNTVVWEDNRNGNWDIYGYDLSTGEEFPIITDASDQRSPAIYGNTLVWMDYKNNNYDIYRYNMGTKKKTQITEDEGKQWLPAIYGDLVAWVDEGEGNRDIYVEDIETGDIFHIAGSPSDSIYPAIYGDYVVWTDERNDNYDIYGYNLVTGEEFRITTDPNRQAFATIYGNVVVWTDTRSRGNGDIYGYNLETQQEVQITDDKSIQGHPAIYGNIVVWLEKENDKNDNDVYGKDISTVFSPDNDGDGFSPPEDCDDNNADIHPGAEEVCDGRDNNCDGSVDEGFDKDNDGFTTCDGDCDDTNPDIHPGAEESCGTDDNCDGVITPCTGNLEVMATGPHGEWLQAEVYLNGENKGKTDSQGILVIYGLDIGKEYIVRMEAEGYSPDEKTITLKKDNEKIEFKIGDEPENVKDAENWYTQPMGIAVLFGGLLASGLTGYSVVKSRRKQKEDQYERKPSELFCPYCKNEIEEEWVTCPYCGAKLKEDTQIY